MVNNYDRIFQEIQKQAEVVAPDLDMAADRLVELAMEIVDHEDRHRIRAMNINQKVEQLIQAASVPLES